MTWPTVDAGDLAWVTPDEMREVDRIATEQLGIDLLQMMENAGRAVTRVCRWRLGGDVAGASVTVLAGTGGNGGGALAAARLLAVAGADVRVHLASRHRLRDATAHELDVVDRIGVPVSVGGSPAPADVVVDGLLGYGQEGPPARVHADLLAAAEGDHAVALDIPTGVDVSAGVAHEGAFTADVTVTLAMPKAGLGAASLRRAVGVLLLADVSIPVGAFRRIGVEVDPPFGAGEVVAVVSRPDGSATRGGRR